MTKQTSLLFSASLILCLSMVTPVRAHLEGNTPPPHCQLASLDGKSAEDWEAMKGDVIYVDFWASWCPPCVKSFPFMSQLMHEFKDKGLKVIGINLDENLEDAKEFLAKRPVNFSIMVDTSKRCAQDFNVMAMPSTYIIDKRGLVRHIHRGFRAGETEELRGLIQALLQEEL
ncbi:TlpA family protein disulfide reductase [Nitrosomonas communis]|uniref:Peroxiredoxin n=1 Tax=Nitrosomonas communis TaxID=44574 RepID=A0A1H2QHZ4_9PROT|nr:TlpA disulfide reductase family protein [Nitrosomonas communis]SDW06498.1 Peroxiredoxin [Nitrosomonas communis]